MPKFAANLSMMYTELPFLDRFEAAACDGFKAVEFLFPYAWPAAEMAARLAANGLQQVLFNAPPGGVDAVSSVAAWDAGQRGTACLPGCEAEFQDSVQLALDYAEALACPRIHLMAGVVSQALHASLGLQVLQHTYISNLRWAARQAAQRNVEVLIEPINTRDMPGYYLNRQDQAHAVLQAVGAANCKVQMDLYHCQITEGDLTRKLRQYLPTGQVGHLQIAGVPDRHEPDTGEVNYAHLFEVIDTLDFQGWVGCEYRPKAGTSTGLGWIKPWL